MTAEFPTIPLNTETAFRYEYEHLPLEAVDAAWALTCLLATTPGHVLPWNLATRHIPAAHISDVLDVAFWVDPDEGVRSPWVQREAGVRMPRRPISASTRAFVVRRDRSIYTHLRCGYCANICDDRFEVDHILPVSRGGTNHPDNLVICCRDCNRSKGALAVEEWLG